MTEAAIFNTIRDLEQQKTLVRMRALVLEEKMPELCYRIAVEGSFIARQRTTLRARKKHEGQGEIISGNFGRACRTRCGWWDDD